MSRKSTKSIKARALGKPDRKKRVNSKVKGNKNELEVANALTKWTGVIFRRTPMSGAIHVPLDWLAGDVFCTDKYFNFPFAVEAKHYAKLTDGNMLSFWMQAKADADRIKKHPMLLARENGMAAGTWKVVLGHAVMYFASKGFKPQVWLGNDLNCFTITSEQLFSVDYGEMLKHFTL